MTRICKWPFDSMGLYFQIIQKYVKRVTPTRNSDDYYIQPEVQKPTARFFKITNIILCSSFIFLLQLSSPHLFAAEDKDPPPPEPKPKKERPTEAPDLQAKTAGGPNRKSDHSLAKRAEKLSQPPTISDMGLVDDLWVVNERNNPCELEKISMPKTKGKEIELLGILLQGGPQPSTSFSCEGGWKISTKAKAKTSMLFYNDTAGALKISLAYSYGATFVWHQTKEKILKPGWQRIEFEQSAQTFKGQKTDWKATGALPKDGECRAVTIQIQNARRTGMLFMASFQPALEK